jgi:hypothetical protein
MMRHGRLSRQALAALAAALLLAGGSAVATADATRHSRASELAQKVAIATDRRLVIVERQKLTS